MIVSLLTSKNLTNNMLLGEQLTETKHRLCWWSDDQLTD